MNNYLRVVASGILVIFALGAGVAQAKKVVAEEEPNDGGPQSTNPMYKAQILTPDPEGVAVQPARIGPTDGSTAEDVDYYKFTYDGDPEASEATFTVQMCAPFPAKASAKMALIELQKGEGTNVLAWAGTKVATQTKACEDPVIKVNNLVKGQEYAIAITDNPATFAADGTYSQHFDMTTNFDYTLVATGLKTAVTVNIVEILVKPNHHGRSLPINLKGEGKVKVAILGSDTLNVADIDTSSLAFGATGTEAKAIRCKMKDVNKDKRLDLVCRFKVAYTGLTTASTSAMLKGKTADGEIQGTSTVKVIASKKHHHDDDDGDDQPEIAAH